MALAKLVITCLLFSVCNSFLMASPLITSISPSHGPVIGGNSVVITGAGFTDASSVSFGLRPADSFNVITDSSISAIVPVGTSGTVDVTVALASQISPVTRANFYTYTESSWKGIISGINQDIITFFDTSTNTINGLIILSTDSLAAIITPCGTTIYAADYNQANVNVIDVATKAVIGNIPTPVSGTGAFDIIVSPDGKRVYISNIISGYVTVIDTTTNTVVADVFVAINLGPLSITPDGKTVYVSNFTSGSVTTIDTATNTVDSIIITGAIPGMIAITPDGTTAYVANAGSDTVSVIDVATNNVINSIAFPAGSGPYGSFIIPTGQTMYVANIFSATVSVVDLSTNSIVDTIPLLSGSNPFWVVSTPDSKTIYVISQNTDGVTPIDVATNTAGPSFANILGEAQDIVMSPDQAPVASFFINVQPSGLPTEFNASSSISPIGTISSYAWDFGDQTTLMTNTPIVHHVYSSTGPFNVTLTVTNSAGTSIFKVFSSRFISNNGAPAASLSQTINIASSPPTNIKGFQRSCRYLTQTDLINVIKWSPPAYGELPVAYRIYRNMALTDLIATIPAGARLKFEDHNRKKKKIYTYYLVSVSGTGVISSPVSVIIKPK